MNAVVFNTVNSNLSTDSFITDNLEKAQLSNLTSILKEKIELYNQLFYYLGKFWNSKYL
jgi:hypothetical protein